MGGSPRDACAHTAEWIQSCLVLCCFVPASHDKLVLDLPGLRNGLLRGSQSALKEFASSAVQRDMLHFMQDKHTNRQCNGKMTVKTFLGFLQIQLGRCTTSISPCDKSTAMIEVHAIGSQKKKARFEVDSAGATQGPSRARPSTLTQADHQQVNVTRHIEDVDFPPSKDVCWEDWARRGSCKHRKSCHSRHINLDGTDDPTAQHQCVDAVPTSSA